MPAYNGYLSYADETKTHYLGIYVMTLTQPHQLNGEQGQTRWTRHFYPRSYAPGALTVTGNCRSQQDYQDLANFVRAHHKVLLTTETTFGRNSPGFKRLLQLSVPAEGILVNGWVPNFVLLKKGVFEPAPQYTLNFTVVFDQHTTTIETSHALKKAFQASPDDLFDGSTNGNPVTTPTTDPLPTTDVPGTVPSPVPGTIPGAGGELQAP